MRFEIEPFERYFEAASETETELLESDSPLVAGIRTYYGFFAEHVFGNREWMSPIQSLLAMHAFMTHLGAVRVALSGHVAVFSDVSAVANGPGGILLCVVDRRRRES